jgi:hypothetical protein
MKRAMKGDFDLYGKAEALYSNLNKIDTSVASGYYPEKAGYIANFKKAILLAIHGVTKRFDKQLVNEQEVLNNISNMITETYVAESMMLRVEKMEGIKGASETTIYRDILDVYVFDAAEMVRKQALDAVYSFASAEEAGKLAGVMDALTRVAGVNVKDARRRIAAKLIEDNCYKF